MMLSHIRLRVYLQRSRDATRNKQANKYSSPASPMQLHGWRTVGPVASANSFESLSALLIMVAMN